MKKRILLLLLFIVALSSAYAQTATKDTAKVVPPPPFVSMLGMAPGPLTMTPEPIKAGSIYISGVASALAQAQTGVYPGDKPLQSDISNAQVFIQKIDGVFQFYL